MPTATIQMKNSAIDRTSEIFSADQVSMCRSCRRARRGPRPPALPGARPRPPRPPAVVSLTAVAVPAPPNAPNPTSVPGAAAPAAGGTAGGVAPGDVTSADVAPGGVVPAGVAPGGVGPAAGAPVWARCVPVPGIACVVDAAGSAATVPFGSAASPDRDPARTELCVRSLMQSPNPQRRGPLYFGTGPPAPRWGTPDAGQLLTLTLGCGLVIVRRTGDCHDAHVLRQVHE